MNSGPTVYQILHALKSVLSVLGLSAVTSVLFLTVTLITKCTYYILQPIKCI